jgi:hypothetical protein
MIGLTNAFRINLEFENLVTAQGAMPQQGVGNRDNPYCAHATKSVLVFTRPDPKRTYLSAVAWYGPKFIRRLMSLVQSTFFRNIEKFYVVNCDAATDGARTRVLRFNNANMEGVRE